jgi:hypothetical protein
LTVKLAVAVVLASVTVIVQTADPVVSVAVAEVFEVTVGVPIDSPEQLPPLTVNNPLAVSENQRVFTPVRVMVGVVLLLPEVGERESEAVSTEMVEVMESVVSEMVNVPVPLPVVMTRVCEVDELFVELIRVTPVTPLNENEVLPVQEVAEPVSVRVMWPLWLAGTIEGEAEKLGPPLAE